MSVEGAVKRRAQSNAELVRGAGEVKLAPAQMWGKGVMKDIRTTIKKNWLEEMTNINQKTIAVTLLMFITVIAPTLTFGAVYGKTTGNFIGAIETIIATSWVGVAYSLIGGMPLCIVGSTGPVLAFTRAIVQIADAIEIPFLTFNVWVSMWLFIYCILAGLFDVTRVVRLATRFTDEIFALLIVSIFVLDAIGDPFSGVGILRYFQPSHELHAEMVEEYGADYNQLETALLSTILGFGTTAMIFWFRSIKFSAFCCNQEIRTSIHDFAVTTSVIIFSLVKALLFPTVVTEQLNVPNQVEPTYLCCDDTCTTFFPDQCPEQDRPERARPWFVSFTDLNGKGYVPIMAAGPAVLAFVLIFLDNGITWHLVNNKSHKIQHGEAYNYDLILNGMFNFVNGMLGLPWLVATTVPCLIHLNSLAEKDKEGNFLNVQETRLTMLFSHIMVGLSLLVLNVLQMLPMPVLYGVFLFMGLSALPNIHFWNRFLMFFQQPSQYTNTPYVRFMPTKKIHLFTMLQIVFFGLVFLVQNLKAVSVIFPLMTFLCIPARLFLLPRFFEGWELLLIDGDDALIQTWVGRKEAATTEALVTQTGNTFEMDVTGDMEFDDDV